MRTAAVGLACLLAGAAIGAGALSVATADERDRPEDRTSDDAEEHVRDAHVIVFLSDTAESERPAIEAAIESDELVRDVEYWGPEASRAEALQIFRDTPDMRQKIENGSTVVPTSYRLLLHDPTEPNALTVQSRLAELPGVVNVVLIPDNLSRLGD